MIVYNNQAPNAVNNVGQFGATEGSIGAYKQAAEYAADAKYWALLAESKFGTVDELVDQVELLYKQGALLKEDIEDLKQDFAAQDARLMQLISEANAAASNANNAADIANQKIAEIQRQLDILLNMTVTTTTLPAGSQATGAFDPTTGKFSFGIPQGQDGSVTDLGSVETGTPVVGDLGFYVDKTTNSVYKTTLEDIANLIPSVRSVSLNGGPAASGEVALTVNKATVGLSNVKNVASYSETEINNKLDGFTKLYKTKVEADSDAVNRLVGEQVLVWNGASYEFYTVAANKTLTLVSTEGKVLTVNSKEPDSTGNIDILIPTGNPSLYLGEITRFPLGSGSTVTYPGLVQTNGSLIEKATYPDLGEALVQGNVSVVSETAWQAGEKDSFSWGKLSDGVTDADSTNYINIRAPLIEDTDSMRSYVVASRDAAVVGVSTVDGVAGAVDLTGKYLQKTDAADTYLTKADGATKTFVTDAIGPIMSGALFKADPFVANDVPFRSAGANGVESVDIVKVTPENAIKIGSYASSVQGVEIHSAGRLQVVDQNDSGVETKYPVYSKRYRPEIEDLPFAAIGSYVKDSKGRTVGVTRTGINSDIKQLTQKVTFTQPVTVPDAVGDYDAVTLRQLHTVSDHTVEDIKEQLLRDTGSSMVGTKLVLAGAVSRSLTSKLGDSISVTDFGAKGDGVTDDSLSFQSAIQAAKLTPYTGKGVFVPAGTYCVSGVVLDCGILLHGEGKSCSILKPLTDGATCLLATVEMAIIEQLEFRSTEGKASLSTGISIEAPLITVSDCAFTFLKHGIITPSGNGAGELIIRHNRFAASGFGVALLGGNINTLFLQNTFNDCNIGLFSTDEASSGDVKKITEGITLNGDRFYACGNQVLDQSAIEIIDTRWITLNSVMSDLAYGNAFRATNVKHVRITGGYYSSNHSTNKSCMVIRGGCDNFLLDGTMLSDSRYFCLEVSKYQGQSPVNPILDKVVFQLNSTDPSQTGDLLVNSASLIASKCSFQSNKAGSIFILDNETGGSKVTTYECAFAGGVQLGGATCKFSSKGSPTHLDFQAGFTSIASGSSEVTVPLSTQTVPGTSAVGVFTVNAVGKNEPVWGDVTSGGLLIKQASTNPTTVGYTYQLVYA